ncbi:MAG: pyrimidine-nucleoside phosphorylase [Candidatus Sumerlaeota bacterium]|nr:pyrimidine-nucleoside phosphorylase [Candidatus Sumerlaeota bacterium]
MRAVDLIAKKRDGGELKKEELEFLIKGYVSGEIPDYQMSAFLMAVFFSGMSFAEMATLTRVMMYSGDTFDLSSITGVKVDKHSTGGVGDKVSLILAPLVASAGVPVPMVSGRGLGHTGGTLDKLESIPGFTTGMDGKRFIDQIKRIGVAIIGQTDNFVPADKKLYAMRDVTATVESIPLISGSIISKKVASGADSFVFDVKTGTGAFMDTEDRARELAHSLIGVMKELGKKSMALITDMNQPLGRAIGNSLEVIECIESLKGNPPSDLREICMELGMRMLLLGERAATLEEAAGILQERWASGAALQKFQEMVKAQGGNPDIIDNPSLLDVSPDRKDLTSSRDGVIAGFEAREIGNVCMLLGAGRATYDAPIDYGVGLICHKKIGEVVKKGEPVFTIYHRGGKSLREAEKRLSQAVIISDNLVYPPKLIKSEIQ